RAMIRVAATFAALALSLPAAAMIGGALPATDGVGRTVVMLTGSHGTFCSGVSLAPKLVFTPAHCVLPGAHFKLIEFEAARTPPLKDITSIARHPDFDVNAVLRHRVTADVAVLSLAAPSKSAAAILAPATAGVPLAAGDRLLVAGFGLTTRGD